MPNLAEIRRVVWRARHGTGGRSVGRRDVIVSAVLTVLAFIQSPGLIVADTKIDLAVEPVGFLGRALHLWDPAGAFGQLQNQAYGYLWPMGPFFVVGTGIGLPAWAVQRLWWALLLVVAYLGAVRLAGRLGIGTPASRLIAGVAFALSPRILTELGALSVEAWPSAVAPWVLLPLVDLGVKTAAGDRLTGRPPRSARRAVALSALAVACAGGVNATAVFAVVPLGFLWLCTLRPWRRRIKLLVAWCAAVGAATAWWLVPLLVLGRYSPPFLDYIESAKTTTGITDPVTVVRGSSHWLAFLTDRFSETLPAGWEIATNPVPVMAAVLLAALGLAGLARPGMPHRRLLISGLLLGFALVGLGHVGELPGTFGAGQREFLDGVGAPLRNVHKFDVLLRLPLALGLAHLLGILLRVRRPIAGRALRPGVVASLGTAAAIAAVAAPALAGGLAAPNGFAAVPGYWRDAAGWLNERADEGRVLVVPGARFPNYTWGDTLDEITQPLLEGPAAVRHAIPLSPATTIRLMDAVDSVLTTGYGSPGLADYLARAGVRYLLVRNDLQYGRSGTTAPLLVRQALDRSPGLEPVASFGPDLSPSTTDGAVDTLGAEVPPLQILRVDRPVDQVVAYPVEGVTTLVGGPESLLWLAEAGLLPAGPTILAGDGRTAGPLVLTDGLRLRDVSFGMGRDSVSATLTAGAAEDSKDYRPPWGPQWSTMAAYEGIGDVRASSSAAQANSVGGTRPEHQPFAAVDGDPSTSWRPSPGQNPDGQWLQVALGRAQVVPQIVVEFDASGGALPTRITLDTGAERSTLDVTGDRVVVGLQSANPVRTIRLTVERSRALTDDGRYGIAEIEIPGMAAERTLVVPAPPAGGAPATVVLTAAPSIPACFFGSGTRCVQGVARVSEDGTTVDRTLTLTAPSSYTPSVWARPRPGAALDALLDGLAPAGDTPTVTASSRAFDEPAARPGAVLDGDLTTTWWADPTDTAPELRFTWPTPRLVTGLRLALADGAAGTRVTAVALTSGGDETTTRLLTHGEARFDTPVWTSELSVRLLATAAVRSYDAYLDQTENLPVAVSEVTVLTDPQPTGPAPDPDAPVVLPCGSGPTLAIGDYVVATRLTATRRDLVERREVPAVACDLPSTSDPVPAQELEAGTVRVVATASDIATATRVALVPETAATEAEPVTVHISAWTATQRRVTVAPHGTDAVLAVRENTNPGWVATLDGTLLEPTIVDGWQQAWIVPAGRSGEVVLRFEPDTAYRAGLIAGAALLLLIVALAVVPSRRRGPSAAPAAVVGQSTGVVLPLVVGGAALVVTGGILGAVVVAVAGAVVAHHVADAYDRGRPHPTGSAAPPGLRRWARTAGLVLPPGLLILGGGLWLAVPTPQRDLLPHLAGFLAIAALWASAVLTGRVTPRPPRAR